MTAPLVNTQLAVGAPYPAESRYVVSALPFHVRTGLGPLAVDQGPEHAAAAAGCLGAPWQEPRVGTESARRLQETRAFSTAPQQPEG
jgi:hypothetical protein